MLQAEAKKFPLRPVLIAILLILLNSYWIAYQEVAWYARLTYVVPFPNVIFAICLLTAFNALLSRVSNSALTHAELVVIYILLSIAAAISNNLMHQLEAFKLTDSTPMIKRQTLSALMMLAAFWGIFACFWAYLALYHKHGAMSGFGDWPNLWYGSGTYRLLASWLTFPTPINYASAAFIGVGATSVLALAMMRLRFFWWPFHPLGYVMSLSYWINYMWVCLLISSVLKWIMAKYGGLKWYRRMSYFFLGLVLGDFIIGSLWLIYGILLNQTVYVFWP
jgi:hypothetical protein